MIIKKNQAQKYNKLGQGEVPWQEDKNEENDQSNFKLIEELILSLSSNNIDEL